MAKKVVKHEELENTNGGSFVPNEGILVCEKCLCSFDLHYAEKRSVSTSACTSHYEYKCPECGNWME